MTIYPNTPQKMPTSLSSATQFVWGGLVPPLILPSLDIFPTLTSICGSPALSRLDFSLPEGFSHYSICFRLQVSWEQKS